MGATLSQIFPPPATLTEENLPNQKGKVFLVTGGASGMGHELARILFQAGGKVYIAGRSEEKARKAIAEVKALEHDASTAGELEFLLLVLDDLSTIKASAEAFKSRESKLDVLFNNAGVSSLPRATYPHKDMIACSLPTVSGLISSRNYSFLRSRQWLRIPRPVRYGWSGRVLKW
jgi:NAD(P)-dependent dehydrogenase (short-subunit alcohol dehydrogenase family)